MAPAALHPVGLLLVLASLVAVGLMWSLAPASYWPIRGIAVVAVGMLAYGTIVFATLRWPPSPPAIRRIRSARVRVKRLLWDRVSGVRSAARDRLLDQAQLALRKIDDAIVPAFVSLVRLNLSLGAQIAELERADPPPSPAVLARSREILERRRESILGCNQLAADAQAELVELLQEADEGILLRRLTDWTEALDCIFDAVDAAIVGPVRSRVSDPIPGTVDIPVLASPPKEFQRLVERALKQLNNARALGEGQLASQLSGSMLATRMDKQPDSSGQPTALDKGHALREILVSGIERLRVADKDEAQSPQYHILREEYVLQLENKVIQARHDIPETNFYRHRRDGVEALTAELWQRERRLAAAREPVETLPRD